MTINIKPPHTSEHLTHPKYRPDIDGLRAVAVFSVIGFHTFPLFVKGGFIGVDIFFVISGYLISIIIIGSLESNSFSFIEFYSRRIKRIFPALLLVLIACFAFGWDALLADEYKQLGNHIAGGAGFVSNFLLWSESGYFDNSAETKPLLHLWSLGIEEQFYIIWPLLLWLAWKTRLNLLAIIISVAAISFALNIDKVTGDEVVTAFYSPQTRFWELLAGSVLAYMRVHKQNIFTKFKHRLDPWIDQLLNTQAKNRIVKTLRNVQSLFGATLVAIGVLIITKETRFPGWWAVLPILGTVLIISAGPLAWLNRAVLANRVLVWFGLISFPLYLWHWPLLSFARIVNSETPTPKSRIILVIISIALAWLTYRLIEKPIRSGNHSKAKTMTLLTLMLMIGCSGYAIYKKDGLSFRVATQQHIKNDGDIGFEMFQNFHAQYFYKCTPIEIQKKAFTAHDKIRCYQSKKNEPLKMAIIGDSHAEHLFLGLAKALPEANIVFYIKNRIPSINNPEYDKIFKYVIDDTNITTVILSAYWLARQPELPTKGSFKTELITTIDKLTAANKKIYIVAGIPQIPFDPRQCQLDRKYSHSDNNCKADKKYFYSRYETYLQDLQSINKENSTVKILDVAKYFCDENFCTAAINGHLLYRDQHHLNINGSKFLGNKIVDDYPQLAN